MKPSIINLFLTAFVFTCTGKAHSAEIVKADNENDLNLASSWSGLLAPTASDIAVWNATVSGANSTLLGANLQWLGIRIESPVGDVAIGAGNSLTLGAGGIDMSAATSNLTLGSAVNLLANTTQAWQVGDGRTLSVTGALAGGGGGVVNFLTSGSGIINVGSGTASSRLSYATINGTDVAALDATKNVVPVTSVFAFVNPNGGNSSGNVVGIDVQTTTAGATQAYRHSNSLTLAHGVRFNAANTQNTSWTVDTSSSGRVGTLPHIIVTGNVGAQDIFYNGSGGIRAASSGGELFLHQLNSQGRLVFNTTINGNGSSSLTKTGAGTVVIASASGYTGVTRINEGTLQLGNNGTAGSVGSSSIINHGNLSFNRTDNVGAGYNISGSGSVTQAGSGTLSLTGTNTYSGDTNFNGGSISFSALSNFGTGSGLNFSGGGLSWNSNSTDISTRTIAIGAGGATFDTNGNDVTLANVIGNGGSGGLVKAGAGTLVLNGANYSGNTTVTGGLLIANGLVAGGAVVDAGGTLGGTANYGGTITVESGGILAPGNSVGTITTGGLNLAAGSILNFEFNNTPANDFINVTNSGGLTINGGGFNLYQEGSTTAFSADGNYNLIGYSGAIAGTGISALSVLNPQAGKNYGFSLTGAAVTLEIGSSGAISNWNADADGSWSSTGNWTGAIPNGVGETAIFDKALTAARVVTLDGGKTVGGIAFDGGNGALGYTIAQGTSGALSLNNDIDQISVIVTSGANEISAPLSIDSPVAVVAVNGGASLAISGAIGGAGSLVKSGDGVLDLSNSSNAFGGDITIAGGTLSFSDLGSLGGGDMSIDGATLRYNTGNTADISGKVITLSTGGGTIDTNGNDVTLAGSIGNSGPGGLTKTGTGSLTLGGANTQTGATSVTGGIMSISSNANLGDSSAGAGLALDGGTLRSTSTFALENGGANKRAVTIGAVGGTFATDAGTTLTVSGSVSGGGMMTKSGDGSLVLSANNLVTLGGAIQLTGGTLIAGGDLANGQAGLGTGAIALGNGTTLRANGAGLADNGSTGYGNLINALSVASGDIANLALAKRMTISSTLTGAGTLNIGIEGTRQEYQGNWSAFAGRINLMGSGEFRIAGFQSNVFNNSVINIGSGITVRQVFNPPSNGNFTTVQNIAELHGAAGSVLAGNPVGGRFVEWSVGASNGNSTFSGSIVNDTGEAKLTKVGSGTLVLDGDSTYTGATTVSAGTLLVNGSLGATAVTVNGGTFGGTGSAGGNVTVNAGALSAGASAGSLEIGGNLDLTATSTATIELGGTNFSLNGVEEYDRTKLTAANAVLTLGGGVLSVSLIDGFILAANQAFGIFQLEDGAAVSGTFGGFGDGDVVQNIGGMDLFITYSGNFGDSGTVSTTGGNDIVLYTIPEPATALLGALGALGLLRRRRN